jgi:hypothetical protein
VLLVGCQAPPRPLQSTTPDGYQIAVRIEPHPNPDGSEGSQMTVTVTPPDPTSAAQHVRAKDMVKNNFPDCLSRSILTTE